VVRTASREFQVFAKPAGALCNLDCRYCYYLKKRALYPGADSPRMEDGVLEEYIRQHIQASPFSEVLFSWHGGEPTVLGLEYFRRIVAFERKHAPAGWRILNGIQTNGLLLDEEWCRFLAAEGFRIGLSLDGPADLHDPYRVTRGGEPTHARAVRAFELLQRHKVPCDLLCAVHDRNVREPLRVYRFFQEIGGEYVGFLPVVERAPGGVTPETVPADAFGGFLCTVFDQWMNGHGSRLTVQNIEEASRTVLGLDHSVCIFRETCGDVPAIEHTGDFYSCDHFVDAAHRIGNIRETPLADLLDDPAQRAFGMAKKYGLPRSCRGCGVREMCNGGCPKDRFLESPDGEPGLNYLCAAFRTFFEYSRPRLRVLFGRGGSTRPAAAPGRNDPCPCGSGRKYKRCCMT
jgi:uncharacterized protein